MKKLICLMLISIGCCIVLHAQIIRPFTPRYNNPSVRGNIVYVSNTLVTTSGSTSTGEMPPAGTGANNAGAGTYINIDAATTNFINYGDSWKYYNAGNMPAADPGPVNWYQSLYNDAAWTSAPTEIGFGGSQTTTITGQGTFVNNPGTSNDFYQNGIYTAYFRRSVNIVNPSAYGSFTMNLLYDDGAIVYLNGIEVGRVNMPGGAVTYTTSASSNANDANTTFTIPSSSFIAGNNVIAVEVHRSWVLNSSVVRFDKDGTLSFNMRLQATTISTVQSSSSSDLNLATCSKVLWAGLYWGADQGSSGTNTAWMTGAENNIKIKVPGSSVYTSVTSSQTNYHNSSVAASTFNHTGYTCYANVTSLLNTTSPNGTYTIADMLGPIGINNSSGGWTLAIAYENPALIPRNLTVFDGHAIVDGGAAALDIGISGFLTPPSGTVSCELGAVVFDGDRGSQDAYQFKQNGAASFYDLATTTAYPLNGTADAWNSKISYKGSIVTTRNPAYNNTLGYDATIMDLPNAGNAQLGNSQSSATVRFSSPSENYIVQVLSTSISQFNPEFTLSKSAIDVNGGSLTGGDVLRYRIDYQNVGIDISTNSIVLDNIPAGATYKPGSLILNGIGKTDASGDDQAEFDISGNRVIFRVGTGATSAAGGQVAVNGSGYVEFDVFVPKSCNILNCANPISNSARIDYTGNTSLASLYDSSGTTASGCFTLGPVINTVSGTCYSPKDSILVNNCPSASVAFPIEQYGGYQFYSSMPFISSNAISPSSSYTTSRIIYAYWSNGVCSDTVAIRIYVTPCPDIDDDNDGIPDYVEANIAAALLDHDADGVPNYLDVQYPGYTDYNSDGINDLFDPGADADNDNTPNFLDPGFAGFSDSNNDGVNDNLDADLDGIPNHLDLDSDNDGIADVVESFGVDTNGDGRIDNYSDSDADGLSQNVDANNSGPVSSGLGLGALDTDGDGIPNYIDLDSDSDGIPDIIEVYGTDTDNNGMVDNYADADGDGFHDAVDGDVGNDGITENTANALLLTAPDANNDGRADSMPYKNVDKDVRPNPYDLDSDGDGITDVIEAGFDDLNIDGMADGGSTAKGWNLTISLASFTLPNRDASGRCNVYDIDADNDGIPDNIEGQSTNLYISPTGLDTDVDGIEDSYDDAPGVFGGKGINPVNLDGDAWPDYLDLDTDGDGSPDVVEGNDFNLNHLPDDDVSLLNTDTDDDGLDDHFDNDNSSAGGTSAYMGNGGSLTGDPSPGSITMVQKSYPSFYDRDWRMVEYVLFIDFVHFRAEPQNKKVQLNWTVLSRQQVENYVVERSLDHINFYPVLNIPGHEVVNENDNYTTYDDLSTIAVNEIYYRLTAVSISGQRKMGPVVRVDLSNYTGSGIQIAPLPVRGTANIYVQSKLSGRAAFFIVDMQGKTVKKFTQEIRVGNNLFAGTNLADLAEGIYYLNMNLNGNVASYRFKVARK